MKKLTFKEYFNSKEELRKAVNNIPIVKKTYTINEYCKLRVIAESDNEYIKLKPKDQIVIEYEMFETPKCLNMYIGNETHNIFWNDVKIQNWLSKNSTLTK